jgi:hypothetical protein
VIRATIPLLFVMGCDLENIPDIPIPVTVAGALEISGSAPAGYSFELYSLTDNLDAFNGKACDDAETADGDTCYGSIDVDKLESPVEIGEVVIDGTSFELKDVNIDVGFVLIATGDDSAISCSTDVVGFDDETKLATKDSAIAFSLDGMTTFDLPRPVRLHCDAPPEAVEPPPPEDVEPPQEPEDPELVDDDNDIQEPVLVEAWTSFTVTGKGGVPDYADASTESVHSDVACDSSFPSVLEINGDIENATSDEAFIRIQFGTGDDATFQTFATPIVDGAISQAVSLTGGYSIVQLDTNDALDGTGESYTVTFCEQDDTPVQEMLTILTWDTDATDVDTHVNSGGDEVAYYRKSASWGDLDIDDIDGFGPETFTSTPDTSGNEYQVNVHYYSDHGNGPTNVTVRAVYVDSLTGEVCDITATKSMSSYEWWTVGNFGPGLDCPVQ